MTEPKPLGRTQSGPNQPESVSTTPEPDALAAWDFRVLGFHGRAVGPAAIIDELRGLFPTLPDWAVAGPVPVVHGRAPTVVSIRPSGERGGHVVMVDGADHWVAETEREVVPTLEWTLTQAAVDDVGERYILLHGGAVARNGRALVMPAASGSGKSTLVGGLVAGGFRLASDEVAAIDPATGLLLPFARALSVKGGSRAALASRYPGLDTLPPRYRLSGAAVWYLMPGPTSWLETPTEIGFVVLPRYAPGEATKLSPLARSAALPRFLEQSFSLPKHGARGIAAVTRLLQRAACYELTIGTLDAAIALLTALADFSDSRSLTSTSPPLPRQGEGDGG